MDSVVTLVDPLGQRAGAGERPGRVPRVGEEAGEHPASHGQRALWFLHRLAPESGAYNIAAAARLAAGADRGALRRAFQAVIDRHPALRTTFIAPGGEPRQLVHARLDLDWRTEDAGGWDEERLAGRLSEEAFRPFDLEAGPLLRVRLYTDAPGGDALLLVVHHAVADLWSLAIIVRELGLHYAGKARERLPTPSVRYSDFARWQEERLRGPEGERLWAYWRERLSGNLPVLDLATDRPRPPLQTFRGLTRALRLGPGETAALEAHARQRGATLFVLLLAAFNTLLHRVTGQDDLLVGAPAAGRRGRELAGVVGYFVNPVALRADLAGDPTWNELMERLAGSVPADLAHQGYPFPLLAERLVPERDATRSPVFQAMLVLERAPTGAAGVAAFALGESGAQLDLGGLAATSMALRERRVLVDVTLAAAERSEGLSVALQLNADLFDEATAERMLGHLGTLLAGALAEPGRRISELPLLSAAERIELLVERNRTASPWPEGLLLHEPFEAQTARAPGAVALIWGEERLTYGELNRRANRIAHRLQALGVGPEARVGVHLRRSPELVAALLGVLKAGGAYVPLDPSYPAERLELVAREAGVALVLVQGEGDRLLDLPRLDLAAPEALAGLSEEDPTRLGEPGNLAYVLYTSGSTGRPKGCAVEHRSPVAFVQWAREVFPPEDLAGVLAATSIGFDLSVFELFVPLSAGGCLVLAEDALALPSLPARGEVRLVNTVPSVLSEVERVWGLPAGVRTVNLAGEPLRRDLVDRLYGRGIERVFNLYGPTEDTTYSTFTQVAREDPRPPAIGRPLANRRVYLLDRRWQPVPDGVPGEVFLGGAGLARGYLDRPDLTAERFVPDAWSGHPGARLYATGDLARWRPDGELELLGRIDHQVKIRGFRIEIGEIEAVLAAHPDVLETAVAVRQGPGGDRRLVAYATARPGAAPAAADLQRHLRRRLPDYMVPAAFVLLPALPRTASGKIDRRALPEVGTEAGRTVVLPRNPTEATLAAIWAELLDRPRIGIHDSFFDLGGHSLLAARLAARVREALGVDLPLAAILASPTVAGLAERLATADAAAPAPPIQPVERAGPLPLSWGQRQIWLDDRMRPGTALYNMPVALELAGDLDPARLAAALAGIVRRHEALRTVFSAGEDEPVQEVGSARSTVLVADLAELPLAVRQQEAARRAAEEARRPFDLGGGLLLRALLLRLGEAEHRLVLTLHHIAADGWSFGVLARELPALYAEEMLPDPALQYGDYAAWQRRWLTTERLAPRLAAARERLADVPVLDLAGALGTANPMRSARGAMVAGVAAVAVARDLARRESATLPMLLLAAFSALLARMTGARTFAVGMPLANRGRGGVEGMIGYLVNPVAVRIDVPDGGSFRDLLAVARTEALAAWAGEEVPFELVVRELGAARGTGSAAVFQVMHAHQDPPAVPALPGLAARRLPLHTGTAKLDLTLSTAEAGGDLQLELEHALDVVPADAASRLLEELRSLLAEGLAHPDRPLAALHLLPAAERRQIVLEPVEDSTPPRTHVEEVLAGIWAGLLDLPRLGVHADLFALGAHSLLATRAVSRLRDALGVELPLGQVIEQRTVAQLAAAVEQARRELPAAAVTTIPRMPRGGDLPLSFAQERLWFLDCLEPGSPAYNMPGAVLLRGTLDVGALRSALVGVVERHEVLRTGFGESGGRPVARVSERAEPALPVVDLTALPAPEREAAERRLARHEARAPFRLASPPLLRTCLLRLGADEHLLLLTLHHIICDGWSLSVLTREIAALFTGSPLPPPAIQFADFTAWQRAWLTDDVLDELVAGWREHLADAPALLDLPTDRPRLEEGARGAALPFVLPADLAERLAALGRARGATPFMVLFAGFQALLHRLSGQDDLVVGTPIAGRTRIETEDLIGLFVNLLPVRSHLAPGLPFAAVLDGAREALLAAYARQDLPFEKLVEALSPERALGWSPLFQALFVLQNAPAPPLALPGLELVPRPDTERPAAKLDLTFELHPGTEGLSGIAEYDPALWDETTVLRFVEAYGALLTAAAADPERPLPDLPRLGIIERQQIRSRPAAPTERLHVAPSTPLEEFLASLWAEILGTGQIGAQDSFFDLGGHSLLAVQVIAAVRDRLGIEVPLRRLFEAPTVAAFARALTAAAPDPLRIHGSGAAEAIPRRPVSSTPAPLSFGQRRLWFLDRWQPGSPAYNLPIVLELQGGLDIEALAWSLAEVARRHEVLRTRYPAEGDEPAQVVDPAAPPLLQVDLAGLPTPAAVARELADQEGRRSFDLARGPVLRTLLLRLAEQRYVLVLTVHHIAADGWSLGILVREVRALYAARTAGRPAPLDGLRIQYADFAAWQAERLQGETLDRLLAFWEEQLADVPAALDLPTDRPRPAARRSRGASLPFALGADLTSRLRDRSRKRGATLFMTLLAGFGALLQRYTGDEKVVIGAPVAGRSHPDVGGLIGFFVNSLALALDLEGSPTFGGLLARARETALAAFAHQELPFEKLVEELRPERDPARTPIFQVMLVLQNAPAAPLALPGLTLSPWPADNGTSKLDLLLSLTEGEEGLAGELTYDTDLFDRTTAERLTGHLRRLLATAVADPGARLARLPLLDEAERHQIAIEWHDTAQARVLDEEMEPVPIGVPGRLHVSAATGDRARFLADGTIEILRPQLERPVAPVEPEASGAVPFTPVEEVLAAIWSEILGVGSVGRHDSFFDLGGHSLLATQVVSRVRRSLGVELLLRDLFEAPSVAALAPRIEAALRSGEIPAPPLQRTAREAAAPLSFAQERLWFLDRLEPGSAAYHIPAAVRLTGDLDPARLAAALDGIVARHETLRSRFVEIEGRPAQVVEPELRVPLPQVDLRTVPPTVREAETRQWIAAEVLRPFDLGSGPLLRALLLQLGEREHVAGLAMHHIAADGWSRTVLLRDLAALYRGESLPPLSVQYADFAVWQRRWLTDEAREAQLAWWKERLAGLPPHLDLPTDRPRPATLGSRGAAVPTALPRARDLATLARREGTSLFMAVLAAFEALLGRYAGREDVAVGVPLANRTRAEVEELIGFFVNPVVMRLDLGGGATFRELLARAREVTLGAYAHQDLPFELLVEALAPPRDLGATPLFQVVLAFQNTPRTELDLPGLVASPLPAETGTAKFDLTLVLEEDLTGALEYRTDLYDEPTIHRLLGHLETLLAAAVADPDRRVADLPLLTEPERAQVLSEWNDTSTSYPREASLWDLFVEQAAATPDAIAVVQGETVWTYAELRERAEALAGRLDLEPEARVALLLDRSPLAIAAMLGVLAAGGAYVPLDPAWPRERLEVLLADSRAGVVLDEGGLTPLAPLSHHPPPDRERGESSLTAGVWGRPSPGGREGDGRGDGGEALAYIMYTSGSTGMPKGVAVPHRGVVRLVRNTGYAAFGPDETILQLAPLAFDASTFEIWGALLNGGRLVLAPPGLPSPDDIAALIAEHDVTTLWLTAGLFHVLVEHPSARAALGHLRQLLAGGDVLSPSHVAAMLAEMPDGRLINGYGPTEGTTFSCCHPMDAAVSPRPSLPVPIGRPIASTRAYVLGRGFELLPAGVPGELYVAGDGLARGYLDHPDLTAERFLPDPFAEQPGSRLYRTGDLARLLPDGNLDFLGRTDNQIKIRGFRIEPGEIEAALLAQPDVTGAVVVPVADAAGERHLAAFYTAADPSEPPSARQLRERLQASLPAHLVPAVLHLLPALPLTSNGKIDRAALARETVFSKPSGTGEPRTPVEELLAGIWAEVLGVGQAGIHDDFFELGGHSLLVARAVARLRESLGVEVPLRALFEEPTPAGLAAVVERSLRGGEVVSLPPIVPVSRDADLVPSFAQERLWFLDRLAPGGDAYNVPWALRLRGRLDPAHLATALGALTERHESLRTTFGEAGGRPVLAIAPASPVDLPVIDLTDLPRTAEMSRLAGEEARRPFDLARGPLLRAALVRLDREDQVLLLTLHHAVCDGGSMPVLMRELLALLRAVVEGRFPDLPALPVQYADYAAWQRRWLAGEVLERELAWWRQTLAGAPALLDLPLDRPRPRVRRPHGAVCGMELDASLTHALTALGRQRGATLFMTLLAALDVLFSRRSGQEDLCVGFPVAGRNRVEIEDLVGLFINTLVARTDLSGDPSFTGLLTRVRERVLAAYAHQEVPFERLVEDLAPRRDLSLTPIFQVLLNHQTQPGLAELSGPIELPGLIVEPVSLDEGTAKLDLTFVIAGRTAGLAVTVDYDATLFDRTTVLRLLGHWHTLLAGIVDDPEARLSDLPLLSEPERIQVLEEWSGAGVDVEPGACVHHLIEAQADRTPGAVALVAGDRELTYAELDAAANRLAHRLRRLGAGPETPVGVCLGRTADLVVALLAVLKAGAAYLPLDPRYPPARLELLLEDSRARLLVTERRWLEALPAPPEETLRLVPLDEEEMAGESALRLAAPVLPGHLAYVMYTSGSTGRPKGVGVEHRNVSALIAWARRSFPSADLESVLAVTSICFDLSVFELFVPLATGGRVVLVEDTLAAASAPRVTLVNAVPSALAELVRSGGVPATAAVFTLCGEPLPRPLVDALHELEPPREVINLYGPTETTVYSTLARMERGDEGVPPIGRPLAGDRIYLVDRHLRAVPAGVAGEILIGGAGVARGYLGRPDWTAARFVPDPFGEAGARVYRTGDLARWRADGELEFLSRIDNQVKLRGFRIEPGEVEAALLAHPAVEEAVVVVREGRLIAYVAPDVSIPELRSFLAERLPAYLLPSAVVVLEALPRTANGKVDRAALPAPEGRPLTVPPIPPSGPTEEALARIWEDLLGIEFVGANESFFELGGHSLLGAQLMARVRSDLQVELPLQTLFETPTVAALAQEVERARRETSAPMSDAVIPRVTEDRDAEDLLSRLDELSDDEVEALLREMSG